MKGVYNFVYSVLAVVEMEVRKVRHDSTELWTRSIQPALWLLVFGEVFNSIRGLSPEGFTYIQFITPGVLAQSVLFVSIFYGITLVWERDVGLLTKLLSTPSPPLLDSRRKGAFGRSKGDIPSRDDIRARIDNRSQPEARPP